MVLFPGGEVVIGAKKKELLDWYSKSEIGRLEKSLQESFWVSDLSSATEEHKVYVPPFWIGTYEVTNAQYAAWLHQACKVEYVVPEKSVPGARTLEEIARLHLLVPAFKNRDGKPVFVPAVEWQQLYGINRQVLDPEGTITVHSFRDRPIPAGTKVVTFRHSVPSAWKVKGIQLAEPADGTGDEPVTGVSILDCQAAARFYGNHLPTGYEWEAAARGLEGNPFPEGKAFDPLAHAWKGFNGALTTAKKLAMRRLPKAREELAAAPEGSTKIPTLQAEIRRLEWIDSARPLPDGALAVPVGLFPYGVSAIGAHDMVGNVDEWTGDSTIKYPGYEGTVYTWGSAFALRGGNLFDRDSLLHNTYRKFNSDSGAIQAYFRFESGGFRMARYVVPGASAALPAMRETLESVPRIMPGGLDKKQQATFTGIDLNSAAGLAQYHDAVEGEENARKVYHLGPVRSLCLVPANSTILIDVSRLNKASDAAPEPVEPEPGVPKPEDRREPKNIPFFGYLHMTADLGIKGTVLKTSVEWKDVAATVDETAKGAEEKKPEDTENKFPLEEPPAPPAGEGDEKKEGDGEEKKDGEEGGEPAEEEKEEPAAPVTLRQRKEVHSYVPGIVKGSDHPRGLLFGFGTFEGKRRAAFWPSRTSTRGGLAPGGHVLLEKPILLLEPSAMKFEKVSKPVPAKSSLDPVTGEATLVVYVPYRGKSAKGGWQITVKLTLGDFEPGPEDRPWETN
jgi:formylglycine-generating enzyme required for sulfatase activity